MTDPNRQDRELVNRMLKGDESAFDYFVDEYYPRLYRFAYPRMGSDPDLAQDVVQGTFEKVIQNLDHHTVREVSLVVHFTNIGKRKYGYGFIENRYLF